MNNDLFTPADPKPTMPVGQIVTGAVLIVIGADAVSDVARVWPTVLVAVQACSCRDLADVLNLVVVAVFLRFAFVGQAVLITVKAGCRRDVAEVLNSVFVAVGLRLALIGDLVVIAVVARLESARPEGDAGRCFALPVLKVRPKQI